MDVENMKSWASQPDVCRCCLSVSGTWDVTASYVTETGTKENYSDMLQECYGITLSHLMEWGPSRMVCALCVGHLRNACSFRKQVQQAEQHFFSYYCSRSKDIFNPITIETGVEQNALESPQCSFHIGNYSEDENVDMLTTETPTVENNNDNIKLNKIQSEPKRKRSKTTTKAKRKSKNIDLYKDVDSDTPIAEMTTTSEPNAVQNKDENKITDSFAKGKSNGETEVANIESKKKPKKKTSKLKADLIDNHQLRSNITLILKNSTITPFRHLNHGKFMCLYCTKSYLLFKDLKIHVDVTHCNISEKEISVSLKSPKDLIKADLSDIRCILCESNFKTVEEIVDHLTNVHNKIYYATTGLKPAHGILGFDLSGENYKCHICDKEFDFFKNLSVHMNEHSNNHICPDCGKKFISDHRLYIHVIQHQNNSLKCSQCDKVFETLSARNYHIKKEHNAHNFKCPECSEVFPQYRQRLRHLVEVHNVKKPELRCDVCDKEFMCADSLRVHMKYSHLKSKDFICDVCGKAFLYKWIWKSHVELHSGVKKFECNVCNKKFARSHTLQVHMRLHTNQKPYECALCKAAFAQKCSLNSHVRKRHPDPKVVV